MKISFNKDMMTVHYEAENDEDVLNAARIQKMTESEEWNILMMAWANVRIKFEEAIKKVRPSEVSFRETAIKAAAFNGFDEALSVAPKIIKATEDYRKRRIEEIEEQLTEAHNVTNGYEPDN